MADYRFVTTWTFTAPIEHVWAEVGDPLNWKNYWTGLEDVRSKSSDESPGRGATYDLVFKSFLPYTLTLNARMTEYVEPSRIVMTTTGELEGTAEFSLDKVSGGTRTQLVWATRTTKPWMNALAFVLRDTFAWNHDALMKRAGRGLADRIGADVTLAEGTAPSLARALFVPGLVLMCLVILLRRFRA